MYLFVDTETSGRSPATSRSVQIAWILTDSIGRVLTQECHIIRPDGFEIEPGAFRVHGISHSRATLDGVPIREVLLSLEESLDVADVLIGHNIQFDVSILQNDIRAAKLELTLHDFPKICTMRASTAWCRITKLDGKKGFKWPTLAELHRRCFGQEFEGAHDALYDIQATKRCFFKLMELDVIEPPLKRNRRESKHFGRQTQGRVSGGAASERPSISRRIRQQQHPVENKIGLGFTSTMLVEHICPGCREKFGVTLTRYETVARCPRCYSIVVCEIDWAQH